MIIVLPNEIIMEIQIVVKIFKTTLKIIENIGTILVMTII